MKYRTVQVMANQAFGVAGTHIEPIRLKDPITALFFSLQITVAGGQRLTHFLSGFTRIEIVDGSDVLLSLSGEQMDGLLSYETPGKNTQFLTNMPTVQETVRTAVLFGRYRGDEQFAFDPSRFDNPQLRITYNGALVEAGATAVGIEIWAEVFDEKAIAPVGFFQNREFQRHTPVTGTHAYINLPTDLTIRKLFVQPFLGGSTSSLNMQATRLDEDNMKRVVFDLPVSIWSTFDRQWHGDVVCSFFMTRTGAAVPCFIPITLGEIGWAQSIAGIVAVQITALAGGQVLLNQANNALTIYGRVIGTSPYQMLCYPFGKQDDPDDWYDPTAIGDLRLRIQGGTAVVAGATTRTILQQVRRYGA